MSNNASIKKAVRDADAHSGRRSSYYYTPKTDNTLQFVFVALAIIGIGATVCGILMNNAGLL
jgi:hypothetical protein